MAAVTIPNLPMVINLTGQEDIEVVQSNTSMRAKLFQLAQMVSAITVGANAAMTLSGGFSLNFNLSAASSLTLPTTGTLVAQESANAWTSTQTFQGSNTAFGELVYNSAEAVNIVAAAPLPAQPVYLPSGATTYFTTQTAASFLLNLTFSPEQTLNAALAIGQSADYRVMVTQGAVAYFATGVQIDGTTTGVTTVWEGGSAPNAGTANGVDVYDLTVVKTGNGGFLVLAKLHGYK